MTCAASSPVGKKFFHCSSEVTFYCESSGWYPEPEVLWLDGEGKLLSAGPTETVRGPDDLYTVSSNVTVEKRHSNNVTCIVKDTYQTRETQTYQVGMPLCYFPSSSSYSPLMLSLVVCLPIMFILAAAFVMLKFRQEKFTSLTVSPDRSQFFKYESLSLSCDGDTESSAWKVKAKTVRGVSECGRDWGDLKASTCIINGAFSWNTGEYWCESTSGETSPAANITITGKFTSPSTGESNQTLILPLENTLNNSALWFFFCFLKILLHFKDSNVILESPVFPVPEGEPVTLRCTAQSNSSNLRTSTFLKDRAAVGAAVTGQITIPAVSKSDEGFYMCVRDVGASAESWLAVRQNTEENNGPGSPPLSASRLACHLVVGTPYLLSTVLLGLIHRDRARGKTPAVTMEETQRAELELRLDNESADVTTEHEF
ncbi:uncharacterized protein LOC131989306 [Centropristis striata]|uniref:uncharacterized protein LOC131989306 n=1 Tax=Centropristis striata TaxID=184440 RepID=UPI0027E1AFCF|nr:uncharacterized protein LOC131989306 [Centropristis striata]